MNPETKPLVDRADTIRICQNEIRQALALQQDLINQYKQVLLPDKRWLIDLGFSMMSYHASLEYATKFALEKLAESSGIDVGGYLVEHGHVDKEILENRKDLKNRELLKHKARGELSLQEQADLETLTYSYLRIKTKGRHEIIKENNFDIEVQTESIEHDLMLWLINEFGGDRNTVRGIQQEAFNEILRVLNHRRGKLSDNIRNVVAFLERCTNLYFFDALKALDQTIRPRRLAYYRRKYRLIEKFNTVCTSCQEKKLFVGNRNRCPEKITTTNGVRVHTKCYRRALYERVGK